jgi:adenylate cyclase
MVRVVLESGDERILDSHRREVTAVFCDPRSFINFAEAVEPEDVIGVLGEHLGALGPIIFKYEDALMRFTGDSLMVFFNDPPPRRPGLARHADGGRDAAPSVVALSGVAAARARPRLRRGHHRRLCHLRPYRLRGALRLRRDRHRHQPRRPTPR